MPQDELLLSSSTTLGLDVPVSVMCVCVCVCAHLYALSESCKSPFDLPFCWLPQKVTRPHRQPQNITRQSRPKCGPSGDAPPAAAPPSPAAPAVAAYGQLTTSARRFVVSCAAAAALSLASRISSKVTNFGLPACRRGLTDGGGSSGSRGEGCEDEPLVFYLVLLIL